MRFRAARYAYAEFVIWSVLGRVTRPERAVLPMSKEIDIIWWLGVAGVVIAVLAYLIHH